MKIVVLDGYVENPGDLSWGGLEALGELTVYDRSDKSQLVGRIGDAEIVITNKAVIDAEVMDGAGNIKYIGVLATGYNVVDIVAAKARGITVTNIPGYSTDDVAQMVFALLLEICSGVGHHADAVKQGRWAKNRDFAFWDFPLIELAGKTIGIFGYGNIGRAVAKIALAFNMNVLVYSRTKREELSGWDIAYVDSVDELLAKSDIVTLHAPLNDETRHVISASSIAKMKDGAILINTSRGPLVNERDLSQALDEGKLYMAGLDVLENEPPKEDDLLVNNARTVVTPHIAWATTEARQRLMDIAVGNVKAFMDGEPQNVVV